MSLRLAELSLDAGALQSNLAVARRAAAGARVMACIKAAGYGHGLEWAATALADSADAFAVACVGEGVELRAAGLVEHPLCVLNGPVDREELAACSEWRLDPVIHQAWQVEALERLSTDATVSVWLKINTGMGRLGIDESLAAGWHARLRSAPAVRGSVGLMTHMACADDRGKDYTRHQWQRFTAACAELAGPRSAANSASVLGWPEVHGDWVRPGIMLYGCSPFIEGADERIGLRPGMTLRAPLIAINELAAGEGIGYGRSWTTPQRMPVGVVGIGYGDGYPRGIVNGTPVLVRGRRAPIVGRVSMDKITIDLRGIDAAVGDSVVLWGEGLPIEEIAGAAGTIGYELMCAVHGRVAVAPH